MRPRPWRRESLTARPSRIPLGSRAIHAALRLALRPHHGKFYGSLISKYIYSSSRNMFLPYRDKRPGEHFTKSHQSYIHTFNGGGTDKTPTFFFLLFFFSIWERLSPLLQNDNQPRQPL